jgi:Skp family chaperone for outer membrane proteins
MNRYLTLTCVLLALASGIHAASKATIYKWVDDNGEVHYTQVPPQNREYETLKQASAPADDPDRIRSGLKEQVDAMDKAQEERKEEVKDAEQWSNIQKRRRENCEIAKKNLANLHQGGNKAFMTPDGEVIRLTDDERQRRIDEANKQIEENCK